MKRLIVSAILLGLLIVAGCGSSSERPAAESKDIETLSAYGNEEYVALYNAVSERLAISHDIGTVSRALAPEYGMSAQQLAQLYSDISILVREGKSLPDTLPLKYPATTFSTHLSEATPPSTSMFSMPASENGLSGTPVVLEGIVKENGSVSTENGEMSYFILCTTNGDVLISNVHGLSVKQIEENPDLASYFGEDGADYTFPNADSYVKVYAIYSGFSEKMQLPSFYYGIPDWLYDTLNKENEDPETSATPDSASQSLTLGQINALEKALAYLKTSPFSYDGLIEQLEYSKFTHEEAVYAADHCGADWNEQAARKAAAYLNMSSFSRQGLIDQLEYEGFTHDQAVYGVEANGY